MIIVPAKSTRMTKLLRYEYFPGGCLQLKNPSSPAGQYLQQGQRGMGDMAPEVSKLDYARTSPTQPARKIINCKYRLE